MAAGREVSWLVGDEVISTPYIDQAGCPVLVVDAETGLLLLESGQVDAQLKVAPPLGTVMLSGCLQPVVKSQLDERARELLDRRCDCQGPVCGNAPVSLIRVVVQRIRITGTHDHVFAAIDPSDFAAAEPDRVIAHGCDIAEHLTLEHQTDVVMLAARVTGAPAGNILAAHMSWIDKTGLELVVLDAQGSWPVSVPFETPLTGIDDLAVELQRLGVRPVDRRASPPRSDESRCRLTVRRPRSAGCGTCTPGPRSRPGSRPADR